VDSTKARGDNSLVKEIPGPRDQLNLQCKFQKSEPFKRKKERLKTKAKKEDQILNYF